MDQGSEREPADSTRVSRRQQRTRERLTKAAAKLIAEKGVAGLRLREITDAADIGFGSFYSYFDSKEALVEAVGLELMSSLAEGLIAQVRELDDPAESASAAHRWFIRTAYDDPQTAWLIVNLDRADVLFQNAIKSYGKPLLDNGIKSGRFKQMNTGTALTYFVGGTMAVTRAVLEGGLEPDAEITSAEVLLGALGLAPADAQEVAHRQLGTLALQPAKINSA
jgi:AcrR family transcriptional regulator